MTVCRDQRSSLGHLHPLCRSYLTPVSQSPVRYDANYHKKPMDHRFFNSLRCSRLDTGQFTQHWAEVAPAERPSIMDGIGYRILGGWRNRLRGKIDLFTIFHNNENIAMNVMIESLECTVIESEAGLKARRVASHRCRDARCTGGGAAWKR